MNLADASALGAAVGTLALAGSTVWNIWAVKRLSIDEASHRVLPMLASKGSFRRGGPGEGDWVPLVPGGSWDPQQGGELGVGVSVRLRNEGRGVALVKLLNDDHLEKSSPPDLWWDGAESGKEANMTDGRYVVPALHTLAFTAFWWWSAEEWQTELAEHSSDATYVPTTSFRIQCSASPNSRPVVDTYKLEFGAYVLTGDKGLTIADHDPAAATTEFEGRSYRTRLSRAAPS